MGRKKMLQKCKQLFKRHNQARSQNFERRLLASSCLSVCLSVHTSFRMKQLGSRWTDFNKIYHLNVFRKSVEKIEVL